MDPGPRPTNAEMAQLVALLEDAGFHRCLSKTAGNGLTRRTRRESRLDESARRSVAGWFLPMAHRIRGLHYAVIARELSAITEIATRRLVMADERAYDVRVLDDGNEVRLRRRT